jgi:histidinol-phosphate aminotransferase
LSQSEINIFKEALLPKASYKGGKGKSEVLKIIGSKKLYKLSSNENILGSSPKAIKAMRDAMVNMSEYPDRTDARLRKALSKFYGSFLTPNQFVTENSGVTLLDTIQRAFLSEGHEIIISNPAFKPYYAFAKRLGAKIVDIPLTGECYDLDVDGILSAINDNTRLVFLTNPNNPTGTHIPKDQLDNLMANIPDHVVVVFDEVYYQYADAEDYTTALPYVDEGKNIIGVNSFSKAYGLAGLRVGYAYSSEKIARYIAQLDIPFKLSRLAIDGAIAALSDTEHIKNTVRLVHKEKAFLYEQLEDLDIEFWDTQANFITIKPEMKNTEFEEAMLLEGVMVRPVAGFGQPDCIRVTIGDREANEAYINALRKVLKK